MPLREHVRSTPYNAAICAAPPRHIEDGRARVSVGPDQWATSEIRDVRREERALGRLPTPRQA
ncbi:hypothetical protein ColTof4_10156 [Colletotrichum tofieldiae]|nr:hypothetical protein ColTof3_06183 [Colletotrichum tofieldiae]GKT77733.1 hypothetical protein ColTof4_10156 [Colletotrichum tofieldiae]